MKRLQTKIRAAQELRPGRALARGFTLIEMALVLMVVGFIASGALNLVGNSQNGKRTVVTTANMREVQKALQAYVIQNGCLPCPADRTGATSYGQQLPIATACGTSCTIASGAGAVPWVTLGLSEETASDGWGRRFTYSIPEDLHRSPDCSAAVGQRGMIRCSNAMPQITGNPLSVMDNDNATPTTIITGTDSTTAPTAYVLLSHGVDGAFGYPMFGATQIADVHSGTAGQGQAQNGDFADRVFASGRVNASSGSEYFDDLVTYASAAALVMGCGSGQCGNP